MPEMRRYEGRAVLVTGGGSGIGEACCERLAAEGAKVAVLDVDAGRAEAVAGRLGGDALALQVDVSDAAAVEGAIAEVVRRLGPLKMAVNNAGIGGARLAPEETPLDQWERTIAVNLSGVFYCLKAEHPHLLAAGGGAIVNTASVLSVVGSPANPAYVAAKHGVLALTRTCALAWGPQGIRVNAVGPGFTPTPLTAAAPDAYKQNALAQMALNAFPQPEDVAATVAFLGSDEARAITGALYMVDAGFTIS